MCRMVDLILIDMDGVIADFVSPALEMHRHPELQEQWPAGHWDICSLLEISEERFWRDIGHLFWADIDSYPWADNLIHAVESTGCEWAICSTPARDHSSSSGKVEWMQKQFGKDFRNYHLTPRKHHLAKPTTLLIDDNDGNVERFRAAGGEAILFPQPWNSEHDYAGDKITYLKRALQMVVDR